ncbi:carbon-nitrogen hydrolase family protein [Maledivibacter halophilus]|uniref:Predicted amidohydrolase n=1 Tax=Maledivibacter halophilus TaxID=36842 RepID=A0A1T5KQ20_9FIRM|nr:carbon-nitrogen hydrolase family protein [Maledivibacter halophilus]SKC65856.1 Predicted amidohydrolase [Maledivibacter halophilus]
MKIGVFQFKGSDDISQNHDVITRTIINASKKKVRLLVFQECATCGYPPVETSIVDAINFKKLNTYFQEIRKLAQNHNMYIALGTIRVENSKYYNSIQLIDANGKIIGAYDKRGLWGWDLDNFTKGESLGIYKIDDIEVGFRICFEVRFPEYFRELFKSNVKLCFVSFCDVSKQQSMERYNIIKSHLVTRAVENVMTVVSVNSISDYQTAPTAVFDLNGYVLKEAPINQEYLLVYDYSVPKIGFGQKGRIRNSRELIYKDNQHYNYDRSYYE